MLWLSRLAIEYAEFFNENNACILGLPIPIVLYYIGTVNPNRFVESELSLPETKRVPLTLPVTRATELPELS